MRVATSDFRQHVKHVDCYTVTNQELESITTKFDFQSMMRAPFHGFAFWFDVQFNGPGTFSANGDSLLLQQYTNLPIEGNQRKGANPDKTLVLSTAPEDPRTHWEQHAHPGLMERNSSGKLG